MKRLALLGLFVTATLVVSLGFFWKFGNGPSEIRLPGTVEVHELRLGSKLGGRVGEVFVEEGIIIEAGKPLIRIDAPELSAARDQLRHRVEMARAELAKAEYGPRSEEKEEAKFALEAAQARHARMIAGWRDEEKRQARNELEAAEASLDLAQKEYERVKQLRTMSQTEQDFYRSTYARALGLANAARARVEMLNKGNRPEDIAEAAADVARAVARYKLLQAGTRDEDKLIARAAVAEAEARLAEVNAQLREAVVESPSRMIVEVLAVRRGDLVPANQAVVRGLLADERWVKAFVPSTLLGRLKNGQAVSVTCDSFPNKRFPGTIIQIGTISEFTPRNVQSADERRHQLFPIKVRVDDGGDVFKAGMAADVFVPSQGAP
jgi:multidrug resistance efflux pump